MDGTDSVWETTFPRLTLAGLGGTQRYVVQAEQSVIFVSELAQSGVGKPRKHCFSHGMD